MVGRARRGDGNVQVYEANGAGEAVEILLLPGNALLVGQDDQLPWAPGEVCAAQRLPARLDRDDASLVERIPTVRSSGDCDRSGFVTPQRS